MLHKDVKEDCSYLITLLLNGYSSCAEQRSGISSKPAAAESGGNPQEVSRLQPTQDKVNTYCRDDRQHRRASRDVAEQKRKAEVEVEVEEDVQAAQSDDSEAAKEANVRRIENQQRK
ncbi:DUF1090 family protein [Pantoea sp. FN060301]|uniref:DUF1090 family protein n=1 Tax=Pantoea sp. FN060301 TaxID=3420380 RepID=UPI003D184001